MIIGVACVITLNGCAVNKDTPSQPSAAPAATPQSAPAVKAAAPVSTVSAVTPSQSLQELIVREERGQTTLLVKFNRPVTQYRHFPLPQPARIVLDILDTTKGTAADDTYRIDTNWVSALRVNASETNLRVVLEIAAAKVPTYTISPENGGLKVVVGAEDLSATAKKSATLVEGGRRVESGGPQRTLAPSTDRKSHSSAIDERQTGEKIFTGQKISLDFKDADIKNIFRLLAEVSGLNLVVTDDVKGKVTIRLIEVPWDQALDLIINTNGLASVQSGNLVRISSRGTLRSEMEAMLSAKRSKEELEPLQTAYFNINYAKVKELEPKIKSLLSKRPDNALVVDERSNTIMVRDIQKSVDDVIALVSKLDLRTPQVLIESNLIETTPSFSRSLGFQFGFDRGGFSFDSTHTAEAPFSGALGATLSVIQSRVGGLTNLTARLTAAEQEGNIKIISRPSVLTLNNVPSTIQSLRILRVALPSSTNIASGSGSAAGTAVATEKIPVGIILTVTPQVSSDGFVLMNISVKSSSLGSRSSGAAVPDELSREAISNVLVRDGETIVIGGIMKDSNQDSESGVPYLKDIPFLGWMFKNIRFQKDFEELMVFITPRIISAGSPNLPQAEELWREQMNITKGAPPTSSQANP